MKARVLGIGNLRNPVSGSPARSERNVRAGGIWNIPKMTKPALNCRFYLARFLDLLSVQFQQGLDSAVIFRIKI